MTTDTRPTPEGLLAEALAKVQPPDPEWVASIAGDGIPGANWNGWALAMFATSPDLARALSIGVAWLDAEAALPEGWRLGQLKRFTDDGTWQAQALHPRMSCLSDFRHGDGSDPASALHALADALRGRGA